MKMPESVDECFYFTNRILEGGKGSLIAWVLKPDCPKCKKAKMGKPVDPKTGKVKKRAEIYVCPACKYEVNADEYDETLNVEVMYKCPYCKNQGETTTKYKRKSFQGVQAYVFECQKCKQKIPITKKMKDIKKKGKEEDTDV
jgi:phage terminase large subunit GpA-like protein